MNKIKYLILLAGLFICLVIFKVLREGVHLPERAMVKWSNVESPEEAGRHLFPYLFPILSKGNKVQLQGDTKFYNEFSVALLLEIKKRNLPTPIEMTKKAENEETDKDKFVIEIKELKSTYPETCTEPTSAECLGKKALAKFKKVKDHKRPGFWISMYQTSEHHSVLFFKEQIK